MENLTDIQLLMQFCKAFGKLTETFAEEICLHRAQASVLWTLLEHDGLTQSELGEKLSVQGATITNMLQRMEEAELITRQRDPEDNRLVRAYLTQTGREKEQALIDKFSQLNQSLFEGFTNEEREFLGRLLMRLLNTMDKMT